MVLTRKLIAKEENLIVILIQKENLNINSNWKKNILAFSMSDGKMGSLKLCPREIYDEKRVYIQSFV